MKQKNEYSFSFTLPCEVNVTVQSDLSAEEFYRKNFSQSFKPHPFLSGANHVANLYIDNDKLATLCPLLINDLFSELDSVSTEGQEFRVTVGGQETLSSESWHFDSATYYSDYRVGEIRDVTNQSSIKSWHYDRKKWGQAIKNFFSGKENNYEY